MISGQTTPFGFIWNTTGFAKGYYVLNAKVAIVHDEIDVADNTHVGPTVVVTMVGDLTADGFVDIVDVAYVAYYFGANPGDPDFDPCLDIDENDTIDIVDIAIVRTNSEKPTHNPFFSSSLQQSRQTRLTVFRQAPD
jgi:hypothetical protein